MAEVNPFQALVATGNPQMKLQHGWASPTPRTRAQRDFQQTTGSPLLDVGLQQLLGRALIPPANAKSFARQRFIRPDLQRRLGGPAYAAAAGRPALPQQLPGFLGDLVQRFPQVEGVATAISQAQAVGKLPTPISPYL